MAATHEDDLSYEDRCLLEALRYAPSLWGWESLLSFLVKLRDRFESLGFADATVAKEWAKWNQWVMLCEKAAERERAEAAKGGAGMGGSDA